MSSEIRPKGHKSPSPDAMPSPDLIAEKLSQIKLDESKIENWLQSFEHISTERKHIPEILQCADLFSFPQQSPVKPPKQIKGRTSGHDLQVKKLKITDYVAVDCEMVGCGRSQALARVAVVNEDGYVVYDAFVEPELPVTDWRTRWSGVSPKILSEARKKGEIVTYTQARFDLQGILNGRTVIGHAINNDLGILGLDHPLHRTIDTQKLPRFGSTGNGLKKLMQQLYGIAIQNKVGHSPVEDARASMLLFRSFRQDYVDIQSRGISRNRFRRGVTTIKCLPIDQPYPLEDEKGRALVMKPNDIHLNTIIAMGILADA